MANSRQLELEIELSFLELIQANLDDMDGKLVDRDTTSTQPLLEIMPALKRQDLVFLLKPLSFAYQQVRLMYPLATKASAADLPPPATEDIAKISHSALRRLHLDGKRTQNIRIIKHKLTEAKNDINLEIARLPLIQELESYIQLKKPRNTAKRLAIIGSQLTIDLAEEDITNTKNSTYTIACLFSDALYHLIKKQLECLSKMTEETHYFSFWVTVLKKADEIGDIHSIQAILSALQDYDYKHAPAPGISNLILEKNIRRNYDYLLDKYAPGQLSGNKRDSRFDIALHLGNLKNAISMEQEKEQTDEDRMTALTRIKSYIHAAKDRAEAFMAEKNLLASPNRIRLQQIKLDFEKSEGTSLQASSSNGLTPVSRSLEASSSGYGLFRESEINMRHSRSEHSTPTTPGQTSENKQKK